MAINKNHPFEDLNGIKCSIVEAAISQKRASFLKHLLEHNGYEVVIIAVTPPVAKSAPKSTELPAADTTVVEVPEQPALFTVGVTNLMFNSTNAIFGRLLKTPKGCVVTQRYWLQLEDDCEDETPYFEYALVK